MTGPEKHYNLEGQLIEEWDHPARRWRTWDGDGTALQDLSYAEKSIADGLAETHYDTVADARALAALDMPLADIVRLLLAALARLTGTGDIDPETDPGDVPDWPSESDYLHAQAAILPGALVRFPAGEGLVYRNTTDRPLGHSPALYPPQAYPGIWEHVTTTHDPDPEPDVPAWTAGRDYAIGDRVTYNGRLYECKVAHTNAPPNWYPPAAHSYWTDLGPVD